MAGSEFVMQLKAQMSGNATSELGKAKAAADSAIGSFQSLEAKLNGAQKALERNGTAAAALQTKLAKATQVGDTKGIEKINAQITKLKGAETALRATIDATNAELTQQAAVASKAATQFAELEAETSKVGINGVKTADGLSKLPGPLGGAANMAKGLQESWQDLSANLGKTGAVAAIAAVAIVAVTVAIAAAIIKTTAWAVGLANAKRNLSLTLEAMEGSTAAGGKLGAAFTDVSKATGLGAERLLDITRELKKAGVAGEDLPKALRAIATQEAALQSTDGTAALIDQLKEGKTSATAMAAEMDAQFGGVVSKRMLSLEAQADTFGRNVGSMFGGLNIEPLLLGMSRLIGLLDTNTASGRMLQRVFEGLFQPIVDGVALAAVAFEAWVLKAAIGAYKVAIALKQVKKDADFEVPGLTKITTSGPAAELVLFALSSAATGLAIGLAVVAFAVTNVVTIFQVLAATQTAVWDAIGAGIAAVTGKISGVGKGVSELGTAMMDGLAAGITAGGDKVIAALGGVVGQAIVSAKNKLDSKSPSKVFMAIGGDVTDGLTIGLDKGSEDVSDSMEAVVEPPTVEPGGVVRSLKGGGGGFKVENFSVTINGVTDADQIAPKLVDAMKRLIEQAGEELGGSFTVEVVQ